MLLNLLLQFLCLVAVFIWVWLTPARRSKVIVRCAQLAGSVAHNSLVSILCCAAVAFACVAVPCLFRTPVPAVHDEFSYLLAGETFAAGRLTNPTHPMWEHFESFHIIQRPTYMSKYQPLQGTFLAAGILLGHPIIGVWLAAALASGSICWMLRSFVPPRWALLGGLITAVHPTFSLIWGQSYWGTSATMAGAALLLGAFQKGVRNLFRPRDAAAMVLGIAMLANGRPFEGLIVSLVVFVALLVWFVRVGRHDLKGLLLRFLLPATMGLAAVAGAMAYYNLRVTGDPLLLPYQVHEQQYNISPIFVWQPPREEPDSRHRVIRNFYRDNTRTWHAAQQSLTGALALRARMWLHSWDFLIGLALSLPLAASIWLFQRPDVRLAWSIVLVTVVMTLAVTWFMPHYLSPMLPALILLVVEGLRRLHTWHCGTKPIGHRLAFGVVLVFFAFAAVRHAANLVSVANGRIDPRAPTAWAWQRARIAADLESKPGKHLVLVRYSPRHIADQEWVYNAADIDRASIVWGREMSGPQNGKLLKYFADRTVWLLEAEPAENPLVPKIYQVPR